MRSIAAQMLGDGKMSLSPRPQRFTTMRWSFGIFGASSITLARAWRGSSAGMMPSSLAAELEGVERLLVGRRDVVDAADLVQPGVLGADAGIVEAGGDRVGLRDLAVVVLQQVGAVAVQHAGPAAGERGGVLARSKPVAGRLDAVDLDLAVVEEGVEQPDGVRAAADAGDERVRQAALAPPASARGSRGRSRTGSRAPSPDRGAGRRPCRCSRRCRRRW